LLAQLEVAEQINNDRLASWSLYYQELNPLAQQGLIELPYIPAECVHNAHMFYIKVKNLDIRTKLAAFLKENGILAIFHYVPLHTATAGCLYSEFVGEDIFTTKESERLLRLPMYYNLSHDDILYIAKKINLFFNFSV
jgi:dTDP-4-amino-4,6-dideoxygalactose transaminase